MKNDQPAPASDLRSLRDALKAFMSSSPRLQTAGREEDEYYQEGWNAALDDITEQLDAFALARETQDQDQVSALTADVGRLESNLEKFKNLAHEDLATRLNATADEVPQKRCPTCDSPSPERHPAMQFEGEVQPCKDAWHLTHRENCGCRECRPVSEGAADALPLGLLDRYRQENFVLVNKRTGLAAERNADMCLASDVAKLEAASHGTRPPGAGQWTDEHLDHVLYRPAVMGYGYGYGVDEGIPAVILGYTATRVKIKFSRKDGTPVPAIWTVLGNLKQVKR